MLVLRHLYVITGLYCGLSYQIGLVEWIAGPVDIT